MMADGTAVLMKCRNIRRGAGATKKQYMIDINIKIAFNALHNSKKD
jgi:hypothetical protein